MISYFYATTEEEKANTGRCKGAVAFANRGRNTLPAGSRHLRSREGAPRRCARPRHTALLTCSRTRKRHPHGTLRARRRNRHARTPPHDAARHISLHNTTQKRTADFQHSNNQQHTPTTRCTQAHDSSRTHARTPGRRQLHRSSSSSGSQQTSHSREHAACSTTIITVINTAHACSTQPWLSSAFIGARIADTRQIHQRLHPRQRGSSSQSAAQQWQQHSSCQQQCTPHPRHAHAHTHASPHCHLARDMPCSPSEISTLPRDRTANNRKDPQRYAKTCKHVPKICKDSQRYAK